ncbi:MAG: hypothetical protein ACK55V_11540 [Alphaproteobacteria bacterium]
MNKLAILIATLAFGGSAALADAREPTVPAQAGDAAARDACLFARQISSWSQLDERTVVMRSGSRKFRVTFVGTCRQAKWAEVAQVDNLGLCVRPGDVITFSSSYGHPIGPHWPHWGPHWGPRWRADGFDQRCMIDSVSLLPPGWKPPPPATGAPP